VTLVPFALWAQTLSLPQADAVFAEFDADEIALGRSLFYDPILSGSKQVSCATCHHPKMATADGLSLGLGDGAVGLGRDRIVDPQNPPEIRIPRNAPSLFNLGAPEFTVFFHDGRLEVDPNQPNGIRTPLSDDMLGGFASALSAQAMFPVLSADEMAGHYGENDVAKAVRQGVLTGEGGAWDIIATRVSTIPEYRTGFEAVLGEGAEITFPAISNALAAFIADEWRADQSPFDLFLRNGIPLPEQAAAGMALFYDKARCGTCHTGQFQTDHNFHAIAMPQIGPGKSARFEAHARDTGRMRVTGNPADAYAFRTPSLRNVALTAPYGHSGAYATLHGVVLHHLDPVNSLKKYDISQAVLPYMPDARDAWFVERAEEVAAVAEANVLAPIALSDAEFDQLISFLNALTDDTSLRAGSGVPTTVPSGLKVDH
jgi:cytochrome c peroxidase